MEKLGWKITAIVFIILFILTWIYLIWAYIYVTNEEERTNICAYEFCKEYPQSY
jgi:regulatory protein YycI of two-component signal transduction system YycFG